VRKARAKTKRAARAPVPCGRCGLCDLAKFRAWRHRVQAGLGESIKENHARFALVQEIHDDVAERYPLGIAIRLNQVIEALACCDAQNDRDAVTDLSDLEFDEEQSFKLNGDKVGCPASVAAERARASGA